MPLVLNKKFMWVIVIWFALLQAISPFIHAHIEADSPTQSHGLHMHEQSLALAQDSGHAHKYVSAPVHTIGVNKALVESMDHLPLPLFAVLFVISLLALTMKLANVGLTPHPLVPLFLRSESRPRAPPLF